MSETRGSRWDATSPAEVGDVVGYDTTRAHHNNLGGRARTFHPVRPRWDGIGSLGLSTNGKTTEYSSLKLWPPQLPSPHGSM